MSELNFAKIASELSLNGLEFLGAKLENEPDRIRDVWKRYESIGAQKDASRSLMIKLFHQFGRFVSRSWRFQKTPLYAQSKAIEAHARPQLIAIQDQAEQTGFASSIRKADKNLQCIDADRMFHQLPAESQERIRAEIRLRHTD